MKYYCKNCHKEITKYSKLGYCKICSNKFAHKKRRVHYCIEPNCKKEITKGSKLGRCSSCAKIYAWKIGIYDKRVMAGFNNPMFGIHRFGKDAPHYIDGESIKENYCLDCGEKIISEASRCPSCNVKYLYNIGKLDNHGRKYSEESKRKMSLVKGGTGISYENNKYPKEFYQLRESIRKRDNYSCQNLECNMTEEEHLIVYGRVLEIHHIDYDKENCKETNLITICKQCNIRANFNRDYWKEFYQNKVGVIYGNL